MSHTVHLAVFALGCLYFGGTLLARLVFGSRARLRAERYGARGAMVRDGSARALPLALFVLAALEARYTVLWIVLAAITGLMGAGLIVGATIGAKQLAQQDEAIAAEGESEQRSAMLAQQRR